METGQTPTGSQTVERALAIVEFIARSSNPVSIASFSRALGLHRNTAYRLAKMLVSKQYLDVENGLYTIGPMLIVLGQSKSRNSLLVRCCSPYLQNIAENVQEITNLGILRGDEVFYLGRWEPEQHPFGVYINVGQRAPLYASGLGKVLLASLSFEERQSYYGRQALKRLTAHTITDPEQLEVVVEQVRRQGYAEDMEELSLSTACVAVPICIGDVFVSAISVAFPVVRFSEERRNHLIEELTHAAEKIKQEMASQTVNIYD